MTVSVKWVHVRLCSQEGWRTNSLIQREPDFCLARAWLLSWNPTGKASNHKEQSFRCFIWCHQPDNSRGGWQLVRSEETVEASCPSQTPSPGQPRWHCSRTSQKKKIIPNGCFQFFISHSFLMLLLLGLHLQLSMSLPWTISWAISIQLSPVDKPQSTLTWPLSSTEPADHSPSVWFRSGLVLNCFTTEKACWSLNPQYLRTWPYY